MSASYYANGYVDVRIFLEDKQINCSGGYSLDDVADLLKMTIQLENGNCEIIGDDFKIERIL